MDEVSYKLIFEDRETYLYACVEADSVSFEMIIEYTNRIVQKIKSRKHSRLLLVNKSPVLPSTDCYLIATYIIKNAIPREIRIAVVDSSPSHSPKQEQISKASRAAGLDIRSFANEDDGEKWLLAGENGKSMGAH